MRFLVAIAALRLTFTAESVSAYQFDTDCQVGSKCIQAGANVCGWCAGGLNPGNSNDRKPARGPLDLARKRGNTCSFDGDCGPGGECIKEAGSIRGVCV
jgi:hypothetical protein